MKYVIIMPCYNVLRNWVNFYILTSSRVHYTQFMVSIEDTESDGKNQLSKVDKCERV